MTTNDDPQPNPPPAGAHSIDDGALIDHEGIQKLLGFPVSKQTLLRWGRQGGWFPEPADLPGVRRKLWWRDYVEAAIAGQRVG